MKSNDEAMCYNTQEHFCGKLELISYGNKLFFFKKTDTLKAIKIWFDPRNWDFKMNILWTYNSRCVKHHIIKIDLKNSFKWFALNMFFEWLDFCQFDGYSYLLDG